MPFSSHVIHYNCSPWGRGAMPLVLKKVAKNMGSSWGGITFMFSPRFENYTLQR